MKRKSFAVLAAGLLLIMLLAGCTSPALDSPSPDKPLTIKIGVSTGDQDPRNIAAKQFAGDVYEKTHGALIVTVNGNGVLGNDANMIDALCLNSGKVDIVITDASNFATYEPKMGISALPFLFDDFDTAWAFMDSSIEASAEEGLIDNNIRVLTHYCNGFRCVTTDDRPIRTPKDMKGLVIRTPENPVIMATMSALGANPQPLGFSELYGALRQGTYDAQENPVPVIYNNNLYEVQHYLSLTNHIYSGMCFAISEAVWSHLSDEQRRIVEIAAKESAETDREMNRIQTTELLTALKNKGMEINEPDLAPFAEATAGVLEENRYVYGDLIDELNKWLAERE